MSKKITDLPVATSIADDDPILITDTSTGVSKQATVSLVGNVGNSIRSVYFSDFEAGDVAAIDFSSSSGSGVVQALAAGAADADAGLGIYELDTGGAAGEAIITHGKPPAFAFRGSLTHSAEARIKLPATPSDITFVFGLDDVQGANSAILSYDENIGTWELSSVSGTGAGNAIEQPLVAAVAGWNTLRVEVDPGAAVRGYVNGTLIATITSATATPQGADAMTFIIKAAKGAAPSVVAHVDWVQVIGVRA